MYLEYSEPEYSEPEYEEPEQKEPEKPAAPSEPVDLNSIIRKGADDPFEMKAEDYEVDPSLAALIKKGADDPYAHAAVDAGPKDTDRIPSGIPESTRSIQN